MTKIRRLTGALILLLAVALTGCQSTPPPAGDGPGDGTGDGPVDGTPFSLDGYLVDLQIRHDWVDPEAQGIPGAHVVAAGHVSRATFPFHTSEPARWIGSGTPEVEITSFERLCASAPDGPLLVYGTSSETRVSEIGIVVVTVEAGRVRVGSNSFRLEGTTDCPGYTFGSFEQAPWTFEWCYCYVSFPWPNLSDDERNLPLQFHDDGTATAAGSGSGVRENGTTFEYAIEVTFRPG